MSDFQIGDCFLFKDSISDFGLILIDVKNLPEGQLYSLFPVRLDKTKTDMDQFRSGDAYLMTLNSPNGQTKDGFMGFIFYYERNFESIKKFLTIQGRLKIKQQFANAIGSTAAENYWGFQVIFDQYDEIFGIDNTDATKTRKIQLKEVLD